jgi:hypothetical protein
LSQCQRSNIACTGGPGPGPRQDGKGWRNKATKKESKERVGSLLSSKKNKDTNKEWGAHTAHSVELQSWHVIYLRTFDFRIKRR